LLITGIHALENVHHACAPHHTSSSNRRIILNKNGINLWNYLNRALFIKNKIKETTNPVLLSSSMKKPLSRNLKTYLKWTLNAPTEELTEKKNSKI